jgi:hypothetical protein
VSVSKQGLSHKNDITKVTSPKIKVTGDIDKTAIPTLVPRDLKEVSKLLKMSPHHMNSVELEDAHSSLEIADDGKYYEWNGQEEQEDLQSDYNELEIPEEPEEEEEEETPENEEEEEVRPEEVEERDPDLDSRSEFEDVDMEIPTEELANEGENLIEELKQKEEQEAANDEDDEDDNQDSDLTSIAEGFNELMPNVTPSLEFKGDIINNIISDLVYSIVENRVENEPKTKEERQEEENAKDLSDQEREEQVDKVKVNVDDPYEEDYEGEVSNELLRILNLLKQSVDFKKNQGNLNINKNAHLMNMPILMKCAMNKHCSIERKLSSLYTRLYNENKKFNKLVNTRLLMNSHKARVFSFKQYQDSHKFRVLDGDVAKPEISEESLTQTDTTPESAPQQSSSGSGNNQAIKKIAGLIFDYFMSRNQSESRRLRVMQELASDSSETASTEKPKVYAKDDIDKSADSSDSESKGNVISKLKSWWGSFNSDKNDKRQLEEEEKEEDMEVQDDPIEIIVQKLELDYKKVLSNLKAGFTNEDLRKVTNDYIKMMKVNLLKNMRVGDSIIETSTQKLNALRDHLNANEISVENMGSYLEDLRTTWREEAEDSINPTTSAKLNAMADCALDFQAKMNRKIPQKNALRKRFKSFMDKYRFKLKEYAKFLETEENQEKMKQQLNESIDELVDQTKSKHVNKTNVASMLNDLKNDVNSRLFKSLNEKNLKYILHNTVSSAIMDLERLENPEKSSNFAFTKKELGSFTQRLIKIMKELNKDKEKLGVQLHTGILQKILLSGEDLLDKMESEQKKVDLVKLSKAVLNNVRAANNALEDDEVKEDLNNLVTDYINYQKVRDEFDLTGVKATKTYDFLTKDILKVKSDMPTRLLVQLNRETLKHSHALDKDGLLTVNFLRRLLTQWAKKKYSSWEQQANYEQVYRVLSGNSLENFKI